MASRVAGLHFDRIASSPLRRCRAFAEAHSGTCGLPLEILPDFRECHFGEWENLTPEEAASADPSEFSAFMDSLGGCPAPGGESLSALRSRVGAGWARWMGEKAGRSRLLVTHAGVIRALLIELFGFSPAQAFRFALPPAACLRISHLDGEAPFLLSLNSCAD